MATLGGILGIQYTEPLTELGDKFTGITLLTEGTGAEEKLKGVSVDHNAVGTETVAQHLARLKADGQKVSLSPAVIDGLTNVLNVGADKFTVIYQGDTLDKIASMIGLLNFYITDGDEAKYLEIKENILNNYNMYHYNKYMRQLLIAFAGGSGSVPTIEEDGTILRVNFRKLKNPLLEVVDDTTAFGVDNGDGTYTIRSTANFLDIYPVAIGDLLVISDGSGGVNVPDGSHIIVDKVPETGALVIGMNNGTWAAADPINGVDGLSFTVICTAAERTLASHKQMVIQPVKDLLGFDIETAAWVSYKLDDVYADHFSIEMERGTDPKKYEVAHAIAYLLAEITYNKIDVLYRYILQLLHSNISYAP